MRHKNATSIDIINGISQYCRSVQYWLRRLSWPALAVGDWPVSAMSNPCWKGAFRRRVLLQLWDTHVLSTGSTAVWKAAVTCRHLRQCRYDGKIQAETGYVGNSWTVSVKVSYYGSLTNIITIIKSVRSISTDYSQNPQQSVSSRHIMLPFDVWPASFPSSASFAVYNPWRRLETICQVMNDCDVIYVTRNNF